jgi:hypothetical protein
VRHDKALYLVRHLLMRYRPRIVLDPKGPHVPQWIIPSPPKGIEAAVQKHVEIGPRDRIEYVDPNKCFSTQSRLDHNRLCKAMRNYSAWQRASARLPIVFAWRRGHYLIWNGNHRITCAILLGKSRMRAHVWRPKKKSRT